MRLELTTLVVICTDFTGSHTSNYHTITTMTAPTTCVHFINGKMFVHEAYLRAFVFSLYKTLRPEVFFLSLWMSLESLNVSEKYQKMKAKDIFYTFSRLPLAS